MIQEFFKQLAGLGQGFKFFQFSNLFQLFDNQLCQDSSVSFFWKGEQRTFKNGKCQLLKINGNKLYSIFVVDSMMSNLVPISDKHKIKSAPEESVKNT